MDLYRIEAIKPGGYLEEEEIFLFEVILFSGYLPELEPADHFIVHKFEYDYGDLCPTCQKGNFHPDYVYDILMCESCDYVSPMRRIGVSWEWDLSVMSWP